MDQTKLIVEKLVLEKKLAKTERILAIIDKHRNPDKVTFNQEPLFKDLAAEGYLLDFVASIGTDEYRRGYWKGVKISIIGYFIGITLMVVITHFL